MTPPPSHDAAPAADASGTVLGQFGIGHDLYRRWTGA